MFEFTVRGLSTAVLYVDGFGDVKLAGGAADLLAAVGAAPDRLELALRNRRLEVPWSATFGDVSIGAPLLFDDEDGRHCLAGNQVDSGREFELGPDDRVLIRRAG